MGRKRRLSPEPFELEIDAFGADGLGRATLGEQRLKVHGALAGEHVVARHLFGRRFRRQAETLDVLRAAPGRVEPPCPHAAACGGCTLQHLSADGQRAFKQQGLLEALRAAGAPAPGQVFEPLAGPSWHYRRKARLSVRDVPAKGRVLVGFRERDKRFVTDMRVCHTLVEPLAGRLEALSALVGALDARATIPQVEVCHGDEHGAIVVRHLEALTGADRDRLAAFANASGLGVYLQPKGPDTVTLLAEGAGPLRYAHPVFDVALDFGPMDFIQVNGAVNRLLVERAVALLAPAPGERVLDLFCGLGNFSLPLARRGAEVHALEGDEGLVARAAGNAERNGLAVRFAKADLYAPVDGERLPPGPWHRVLLDPPRSGAGAVLDEIGRSGAKRLVYVSCNPETLAGDCARLSRNFGYRLDGVGIVDMFPHTTHVESIAVLERSRDA